MIHSPSKKLSFKAIGDYFFICGLGALILGYSAYTSSFAETSIYLPFLSFPIFIGEIGLAVCLVWIFVRLFVSPVSGTTSVRKYLYGIVFFSVWILIKTYLGYHEYGPLSLRNAALFYYFWYAVLSYFLLTDKRISESLKIIISLSMFVLVLFRFVDGYSLWFYVAMMTALGLTLRNPKVKMAVGVLLVFLIVMKFPQFFMGSRSHLVSMLGVFLYLLASALIFTWRDLNHVRKTVVCCLFLGGLSIGLIKFADKNELVSLVSPKEILRYYEEYRALIREREGAYEQEPLPAQLFNPNVVHALEGPEEPATTPEAGMDVPAVASQKPATAAQVVLETPVYEMAAPMGEWQTAETVRPLADAYGNIVFRLLVWRDMVVEMREERAWGGISFGKPQRSTSIEICRWAMTEWQRDGWITPHNSFLHMIYRGGIMGFIFFAAIIGLIVKLTRGFIAHRSFSGIFLVSGLIYWLILSQFLVILELPYIAIPFWCLFGATLAYAHQLGKNTVSENTPHP